MPEKLSPVESNTEEVAKKEEGVVAENEVEAQLYQIQCSHCGNRYWVPSDFKINQCPYCSGPGGVKWF